MHPSAVTADGTAMDANRLVSPASPVVRSVGPVRRFRQRSRSFDNSFLSQLQAFHQAQPIEFAHSPPRPIQVNREETTTHNNAPMNLQQLQEAGAGFANILPKRATNDYLPTSNQSPLLQQQFLPLPNIPGNSTSSNSTQHYASPRSGRISPTQHTSSGGLSTSNLQSKRGRMLRSAYLSLNGVTPPTAGHPSTTSPRLVRQTIMSPSKSKSSANSPRTPTRTLHLYHANGYLTSPNNPMMMQQPSPYNDMSPASRNLLQLPSLSAYPPPPQPLLAQRINLLSSLVSPLFFGSQAQQYQPYPMGSPYYGYQNPTPPNQSQLDQFDDAMTRTTSDAESSHRPPPVSLLDLHNEFIEVTPKSGRQSTHESTDKQASTATKKRRGSGSKSAATAQPLPSIHSALDKAAASPRAHKDASTTHTASTSALPEPSSNTITFAARRAEKSAAQAALLKEIQARKVRVQAREEAALAKATELETQRVKAAEAAKQKALKLEQEQAKQREALAAAAFERAKQAAKEKEAKLAEEEEQKAAKAKEAQALARLRSQLPVPTFFNPTLAYALKVESSNRGNKKTKDVTAAVGTYYLDEKQQSIQVADSDQPPAAAPETGRSRRDHLRRPSLYDGSDWDELHSLAEGKKDEDDGSGEEEEDDVEEDIDEEGDEDGAEPTEGEEKTEKDEKEGEVVVDPATTNASSSLLVKPTSHPPPRHSRSMSSVARAHIASQFNRISTKHVVARKHIQTKKKQKREQLSAALAEKQEKINQIKQHRFAELRKMQAAMDAAHAAQDSAAQIAESYVRAMKLAKAAKDGDLDRIRALSLDPNETDSDLIKWVNRHDSAGSTAIFHATWTANIAVLELLFSLGADVNIVNNRQNTALHLACDRAHYSVIRLLIFVGANPLLKNHERNAPFEMQSQNSSESLEMALYIRQCLEDLILEKRTEADRFNSSELGVGMANAIVQQVDEKDDSSSSENTATATTNQRRTNPATETTPPRKPGGLSRSSSTASSLSALTLLTTARQYLVGINTYITGRIQLSQSMRRIKMKIWSAIRFSRTMTKTIMVPVTEEEVATDANDKEATTTTTTTATTESDSSTQPNQATEEQATADPTSSSAENSNLPMSTDPSKYFF